MAGAEVGGAGAEGGGGVRSRGEIAQVFQQSDGFVVLGSALHLDQGLDLPPELFLAAGQAVEMLRSGNCFLALAACSLLSLALGYGSLFGFGALLGGGKQLLHGAAGAVGSGRRVAWRALLMKALVQLGLKVLAAFARHAEEQRVLFGYGKAGDSLLDFAGVRRPFLARLAAFGGDSDQVRVDLEELGEGLQGRREAS